MTVKLTQPVEGMAVDEEYSGDREDWLVAQGYATRVDDLTDNRLATDVKADQDPTHAANREAPGEDIPTTEDPTTAVVQGTYGNGSVQDMSGTDKPTAGSGVSGRLEGSVMGLDAVAGDSGELPAAEDVVEAEPVPAPESEAGPDQPEVEPGKAGAANELSVQARPVNKATEAEEPAKPPVAAQGTNALVKAGVAARENASGPDGGEVKAGESAKDQGPYVALDPTGRGMERGGVSGAATATVSSYEAPQAAEEPVEEEPAKPAPKRRQSRSKKGEDASS